MANETLKIFYDGNGDNNANGDCSDCTVNDKRIMRIAIRMTRCDEEDNEDDGNQDNHQRIRVVVE